MTRNTTSPGLTGNDTGQAKTLTLEVYERLRVDIRSGILSPGVPLRMEWLKTNYNVGATPLREALSRLAAEYLVTSEGKRGFRVALVSLQEYKELISLRNNIEHQALGSAVRLVDDDWEAEIVGALHRLIKAPDGSGVNNTDAVEEREKRHRAFHVSLITACDSTWLLRIWWHMTAHLERYSRVALRGVVKTEERARQIEQEHRDIADAVLRRDAEAASVLQREQRRDLEKNVNQWASQI